MHCHATPRQLFREIPFGPPLCVNAVTARPLSAVAFHFFAATTT